MSKWLAVRSRFARALGLTALAAAALLVACIPSNQLVDPDNGQDVAGDIEVVSYGVDIQPIFDANCITCHQPGGEATAHGIDMDLTRSASYDSLIGQRSQQDDNFLLVQPGAPDLSWLYIKISRDAPPHGLHMPPFQQLSDTDLQKISTWILSGAAQD